MMNRSKVNTCCSLLIIAFFFAFLFGLFLLSAYGILFHYNGYSYFENRNLAPFPEIKAETVSDGTFFTSVETWYRDHIAKRNGVLAYHTRLNLDLLRRPVVNEVVIAENGVYLPYNTPETVDLNAIDWLAAQMSDRLSSHAEVAASVGAKFYYVAVPCQYVYYEDSYPWYLNSRAEYTAASSAALFRALTEKGVPYIDMKEVFENLGHLPAFSSDVDNHYSLYGAIETYRCILERYNRDTGLALPILSEDDYTVTELPNPYLGSRTRKLLGLRGTEEHLAILTLNEEIPFTRYNYGSTEPSAPVVYSLPQNEEEAVSYSLYMGGDCSITELYTNRPDLPSILIYGDSFTNAVECVIWYNFDAMYSLDLRHYSDMTLDDFIRKANPDLVVCIRDYEALLNLTSNGQ